MTLLLVIAYMALFLSSDALYPAAEAPLQNAIQGLGFDFLRPITQC